MFKSKFYKISLYIFFLINLGLIIYAGNGIFRYVFNTYEKQDKKLIDFEYKRDINDILSIFDRNWYWLMPYSREEYDSNYLPYVFEYRAPQANPLKKGSLIIKVIRKEDRVIAFTVYYMKSKTSGFLLFVAVDNDFRGKKYGETLVTHALKAMMDLGAKQIQLNTRIDNTPAQSLYKKMGFTETVRQGAFVYYTYKV